MDVLLAKLPGDPVTNAAAIGVVVLALLDFVIGTVRAVADGTFTFESFSTWVRAQLLGHVIPIILLLTFGQVIGSISVGGLSFNVVVAAGLAGAASYAATTINSVIDSVNPSADDPIPPPAT